jgi:methionyl-tRNA formyltransferase
VRIVFFGTPEFAIPPFHTLLKSPFEVLAVVTRPDTRGGRGKNIKPSPVKVEAQQAGMKLYQPRDVKEKAFLESIRSLKPVAIVVVAFGQILPPELIHLPGKGCINVHASLLPKYRGAAPINWAIIHGEETTGVTTMLMDEGMDTGPIFLQKEIRIDPDDTAGSLSTRLSETGAQTLLNTLEKLNEGDLEAHPQRGNASFAPVLKKSDGLIDWSKSAGELSDFIRGMNPWPGAYSFIGGERVKILRAVAREGNSEAGMLMEASKDTMLAGTGSGMLSILEIQRSGKHAMDIRAFLQGRRLKEGMKFHDQE